MDMSANDGNSSSSSRIPFKKPRGFVNKWLQDPTLSEWLKKHEDGRAWCTVCEVHLNVTSPKCVLLKHAKSILHKMNMQKKIERAGTSSDVEVAKIEMKTLQIRYSLLAIERNHSFETIQALNKLNQCIIGSKLPLPKAFRLGRSKISAIIKNVINKSIILDVQEVVKEKYFSLIIDESTDLGNIKNFSILVRFVNNKCFETHLLDSVTVEDATAENVYKCIVHSLNKFNLSISKIVGIGVYNASMMIGCNNSVMSRFQNTNSEILTFTCLCYSMHLIAAHAIKCTPKFIDELLQDIYEFTRYSRDIRNIIQLERRKVLRPCQTRWLAQVPCIGQILEQWDPLFSLFAADHLNDNLNMDSIYSQLSNDFTKPYLQFLHYVLTHFRNYNMAFQSSKILIYNITDECKSFLRILAAHFIKQQFLKGDNFERVDANDPTTLLPLEDIFIGANASKSIQNLRESKPELSNQIIQFYKVIQRFFQIAYVESVKRLPYNNQFVEALNFLSPQVALYYNKHIGQIEIIVEKFSSKVNRTKVINQWFLLAAQPSADVKEKLKTLDVVEFWSTVSNLKDSLGDLLYDEVAKLAFICLSLPHSNADVERYFSVITNIKIKKRNQLNTHMVCALARAKLYMQSKHLDASSFPISDQVLEFFNSDMYSREQIPLELNGVLLPDETENSSSDSDEC